MLHIHAFSAGIQRRNAGPQLGQTNHGDNFCITHHLSTEADDNGKLFIVGKALKGPLNTRLNKRQVVD